VHNAVVTFEIITKSQERLTTTLITGDCVSGVMDTDGTGAGLVSITSKIANPKTANKANMTIDFFFSSTISPIPLQV